MDVSLGPMVPGDPLRLSASLYVTWKKCPDQAHARLQGIYGPDTRPAFLGTLAHRVFSRHLSSGPIASADFVQACREEIGGSNLNNKLAGLEMKPSTLAGVIEEVRGLYERFVNLPDEGFEGAEVDLEYSEDDVDLIGKVDAVFREDLGGHRLVDWKTGELFDSEDQLLFYALLWVLAKEEMPAYVEAVSVRTGERYKAEPTEDDLERVAAEVTDLANEVRRAWAEGSAMSKRAGPWCRFCPILDDCAEGRAAEALLS